MYPTLLYSSFILIHSKKIIFSQVMYNVAWLSLAWLCPLNVSQYCSTLCGCYSIWISLCALMIIMLNLLPVTVYCLPCVSCNAVCHPMERQLSCDSVSSVTSTVSGASMSSFASLGSHSLSAAHTPHCSHLNHTHAKQIDATNATSQAKLKKRSWVSGG